MKRCISTAVATLVAAGAFAIAEPAPADAQVTELRWATSQVGSSGHRALVSLMTMLNREMEDYSITVLPTPGAAASVRGFATGQFDAYYGADIAFHEIANNDGRYEGFQDQVEHELLQSFWTFTLENGLGVRAADLDQYEGWRDLAGAPVFTGPAPWDTRAALERAMQALEVGHEYIELDIGLAGSAMAEGQIDAVKVYTTGGDAPAPWVSEAMLTTDIAVLNPSEEELELLSEAGIEVVDIGPEAFETDIHTDVAKFVPFFYGFHVGLNVPEEDVYRMLTLIEEHSEELVSADPGLSQIHEDMVGMQVRGIESTGESARIHPGLALYLRERDAWNDAWDDRVAD